VQHKAFGEAYRELVYVPLTPCRLVDTRGFGAPIAGGAFTPGARRTMIPLGACGIPGAGITSLLLGFTTQNQTPNSGGYIAIVAPGAAINTTVDIFNLGSEWSASNTITLAGPSGNFDVFVAGAMAHVIIDVLGYFGPPPAGSVGTAIIADAAVTTAKLADNAVSGNKLANGSVTGAKIDSSTTITAADFAYATPVVSTLFVPPHTCHRAGGGIAPYQDVLVYDEPGNYLSPAVGATAGNAGILLNCPIELPVRAGATIRLTGATAYLIDVNNDCRVQLGLTYRVLPGANNSTTFSTIHSGTGATDYAYTSPGFNTMEERAFPAFNQLTVGTNLHLYVAAYLVRSGATSGDCRYGGVKVAYTVDRP
jgi:hypothetical protein